MKTTTLDEKVDDFLAQRRIAIAGVSRDNSHHPAANLIYHRLKSAGHDVFPVNPHMQTFEGDHCYPDLQSIPGGVDGVVIITRPRPQGGSCATAAKPESGAFGCTNPWRRDRASRRMLLSTAVNTISA